MATPLAEAERQRLFDALGWPAHQTLAFHWARLVEALQAAEEIEALAADPELGAQEVRTVPAPLAGPSEGVGVVEAPRGTLIHHYAADAGGLLTAANLVVASQHNAAPVQISVRKAARGLIRNGKVDPALLNQLEMAFRAYDPCNACASHALPGELPLVVTIRGQDGAVREVIRRRVPDRTRRDRAGDPVDSSSSASATRSAATTRWRSTSRTRWSATAARRAPTVRRSAAAGLYLLDDMEGFDRVVVVDAVRTGAHPPGTVLAFPLDALHAPEGPSPHAIGLPSALARAAGGGRARAIPHRGRRDRGAGAGPRRRGAHPRGRRGDPGGRSPPSGAPVAALAT